MAYANHSLRWHVWRRFGSRVLPRTESALVPILIALSAIGLGAVIEIAVSPWSPSLTLRHRLAAPNCDAARAVGLAPARWGEPGYYIWHDADNDGIACEPWPIRRVGRWDGPARPAPGVHPGGPYPQVIYPSR